MVSEGFVIGHRLTLLAIFKHDVLVCFVIQTQAVRRLAARLEDRLSSRYSQIGHCPQFYGIAVAATGVDA